MMLLGHMQDPTKPVQSWSSSTHEFRHYQVFASRDTFSQRHEVIYRACNQKFSGKAASKPMLLQKSTREPPQTHADIHQTENLICAQYVEDNVGIPTVN